MVTLAKRGRRCVHLHLPDNSGVTLRLLAQVVEDVIADIPTDRALAEAAAAAEDEELAEATVVVEAAGSADGDAGFGADGAAAATAATAAAAVADVEGADAADAVATGEEAPGEPAID